MKHFRRRLDKLSQASGERRWLFVPYDQLSDRLGALAEEAPGDLGIVLIESSNKASRRPYHRQKLALVLANQRHFALEQAERGVAVRYVATEEPYGEALSNLVGELGPLQAMEPAERELRAELAPLVETGAVEIAPHGGWLTTQEQFDKSSPKGPPWRMDSFYRRVRQDSGILMEGGKPAGGKYSFDAENRKPWKGEPAPPEPPRFDPDDVTREVGDLIAERFDKHPGRLRLETLPATRADAEALWTWALDNCLGHFGPYEDAMSRRSRGLFHTRVSALVNIHRLLPGRLVEAVAGSSAPLACREGFIRQVLGWREFMRYVHRKTDGFRTLPEGTPVGDAPGDGGWSSWSGKPWSGETPREKWTAGAEPNELDADMPLPPAYWGKESGLACLDTIVEEVWEEGYTHHIPRLMVLANLGTLLGVRPRELTDWFWVAFADAYDWVVEPNVLGMGTYADGGLFTTKPYVSGANYIHKMSDYCESCRFDPKTNCPITRLYWSFLARNRHRFDSNPRMRLVMRNLERRAPAERAEDERRFKATRNALGRGEALSAPDSSSDE